MRRYNLNKKNIENWINNFIFDNLNVLHYSAIHIDDINYTIRENKFAWLNYTIKCYEYANKYIFNNDFKNIRCYIFIDLISNDNEIFGVDFKNINQLTKKLSFTPPELVLENKIQKFSNQTLFPGKEILISDLPLIYKCYFDEKTRIKYKNSMNSFRQLYVVNKIYL